MNNLFRRSLVIATVVCLIVIALIVGALRPKHASGAGTGAPPDVLVAQVEQKDVPIYSEWIGTLAGQVNANVQAQVTGYLLKRDYQEGSFVRKGQLLFVIDPRPFQAALDQAEGQLAQATAQRANAEAVQVRTQLDVERYMPLAKEQAASQQDLDNATQNNLAAKANVATAKAQIQTAEAAIETAKLNLGFTQVISPVDGVADVAKAQVGDLVSTSSGTLTTVSTLDPIRDYFTVSEQDYVQLQKQFSGSDGQRWKLELILADGTTYSHEGAFYFAGRAVDQNTGAIQLAALFPNPGNVLRPGQYGKVRAVVRTQKGALLVPQAAVTDLQGSYQVDVVGGDDKIAIRPVKVGERIGTMWIIQDGLKPGELVVAQGQQALRPGTTVRPKPFVAQ
ncbi:MAG TPA: efflux RND transporter periplasmic adaptor subunit [Terriglobales bacterium]|nr:efflux RND transporter periplasmic adaptor subunit [Terriglobales bacterium]